MIYRVAVLSAVFLAGMGVTIPAYAGVSNIQIVNGTCDSKSNTAEGPLGSDLTKQQSRFYCDSAVFTFFDDYPGHVLIDFSQKVSQHSPILGFAGRIEARQPGDAGTMMQVKSVYLGTGEATTVSDGWCTFFSKNKQVSSIFCNAIVDETRRRTAAAVMFTPTPGQTSQFAAQPDLPNGNKTETLPNGTQILTLPNGNKVETLADGTNWAVIHPNGEVLTIQLDPRTMPTSSGFHTVMIVNLPESDIVNAPQSERIQVDGECQSRTYQILGVLPYSRKNGGGMPDVDSAAGPEGVLRKVMPDTRMWHVFNLVCKKN